MRKLAAILCLLSTLWCCAIVQKGYVITPKRPNVESKKLEGVVVRFKGYNSVQTDKNGNFTINMPDKQNGDALQVLDVFLDNYDTQENSINRIICSDKEPIEIILINKTQREYEKNEHRRQYQAKYDKEVKKLENELNKKIITLEQYQLRLNELEEMAENWKELFKLCNNFYDEDISKYDKKTQDCFKALQEGDFKKAGKLLGSINYLQNTTTTILEEKKQHKQQGKQINVLQQKHSDEGKIQVKKENNHAQNLMLAYQNYLLLFHYDSAEIVIKDRARLDKYEYKLDATRFLQAIGKYDSAIVYLQQADLIAQEQYGKSSHEYAMVMHEYATINKKRGFYNEAIKQFNKIRLIYDEIDKKKYILDYAQSINNLGGCYLELGQLDKAKYFCKEAWDIRRNKIETPHADLVESLNNLGTIHGTIYSQEISKSRSKNAQKELNEAYNYYKQALEFIDDAEWAPHMTATYYENFARICAHKGLKKDALYYFDKAYNILSKRYGYNHPEVIELRNEILEYEKEK